MQVQVHETGLVTGSMQMLQALHSLFPYMEVISEKSNWLGFSKNQDATSYNQPGARLK